MTDQDDQLATALAAAVQRLGEKPRKGVATWAGYSGSAGGFVAFAIEQSTRWNLSVPVQVALILGAAALGGITGLGRQLQSVGKTKALGQVTAAAAAPVAVPPAVVLGVAREGTVEGGFPKPDAVL